LASMSVAELERLGLTEELVNEEIPFVMAECGWCSLVSLRVLRYLHGLEEVAVLRVIRATEDAQYELNESGVVEARRILRAGGLALVHYTTGTSADTGFHWDALGLSSTRSGEVRLQPSVGSGDGDGRGIAVLPPADGRGVVVSPPGDIARAEYCAEYVARLHSPGDVSVGKAEYEAEVAAYTERMMPFEEALGACVLVVCC